MNLQKRQLEITEAFSGACFVRWNGQHEKGLDLDPKIVWNNSCAVSTRDGVIYVGTGNRMAQ